MFEYGIVDGFSDDLRATALIRCVISWRHDEGTGEVMPITASGMPCRCYECVLQPHGRVLSAECVPSGPLQDLPDLYSLGSALARIV